MNKQSNTYTILYITILVIVVGAALAWVSTALKPQQQMNADADKMAQILKSVHCPTGSNNEIASTFKAHINGIVIDTQGQELPGLEAFDINVAQESRQTDKSKRQLPIFIYTDETVGTKYILPVYGQGLWGPIWGYVAINDDGSTIYGAYFSHQGETPGLGAEIEKPFFSERFTNKQLLKNGVLKPIAVVKAGARPQGDEDYVDGISGGTITSKGVGAMLDNCLAPYSRYLEMLNQNYRSDNR